MRLAKPRIGRVITRVVLLIVAIYILCLCIWFFGVMPFVNVDVRFAASFGAGVMGMLVSLLIGRTLYTDWTKNYPRDRNGELLHFGDRVNVYRRCESNNVYYVGKVVGTSTIDRLLIECTMTHNAFYETPDRLEYDNDTMRVM